MIAFIAQSKRFVVLVKALLFVSLAFVSNVIQADSNNDINAGKTDALVNEGSRALKALSARLQKLEPFTSRYRQSLIAKQGDVLEKAVGQFVLGKDRAFKNYIEEPDNSVIISNGDKLWMMDHDLEQVTVNHLDDFLQGTPLALLLDNPEESLQDFLVVEGVVSQQNNIKQKTVYQLEPKNSQLNIKGVRITFQGNHIADIEIDQLGGNRIQVSFYDSKNIDASAYDFSINIPQSYDLIDQTQ